MTEPVISVCVITFNQERYVERCLRSILRQDAPLEVVVRDDGSHDQTPAILARIAAADPRVRVLETQANLGMNRNLRAVMQAARTRYIALCEGDDYWLDRHKLTRQIKVLDKKPTVNLVTHPCIGHDGAARGVLMFARGRSEVRYGLKDVIDVPGQFAPTASYVFRRDAVGRLPGWVDDAPVGDFFIELYALGAGQGVHLPQPMSAYRRSALGSWTVEMQAGGAAHRLQKHKKMLRSVEHAAEDSLFADVDFGPKLSAVYLNIAWSALFAGQESVYRDAIIQYRANVAKPSRGGALLHALRGAPRLALLAARVAARRGAR